MNVFIYFDFSVQRPLAAPGGQPELLLAPLCVEGAGRGSLKVLMYRQRYKEGWLSPGTALSSVCCLSEYHDVSQVAI